jgi:hypothetical protein
VLQKLVFPSQGESTQPTQVLAAAVQTPLTHEDGF